MDDRDAAVEWLNSLPISHGNEVGTPSGYTYSLFDIKYDNMVDCDGSDDEVCAYHGQRHFIASSWPPVDEEKWIHKGIIIDKRRWGDIDG